MGVKTSTKSKNMFKYIEETFKDLTPFKYKHAICYFNSDGMLIYLFSMIDLSKNDTFNIGWVNTDIYNKITSKGKYYEHREFMCFWLFKKFNFKFENITDIPENTFCDIEKEYIVGNLIKLNK